MTPFATAGAEGKKPLMSYVHSGSQTTGVPEQFLAPAASKAEFPAYTTPFATARSFDSDVVPVHRGWQTTGVPEQFRTPAASYAASVSSEAARNTMPSATVGELPLRLLRGAVHRG